MATKRWVGGAPAVAQVQDYVFAGTWEATDVITLTRGNVTVSTTAGSTVTATVVSSLVTTWNALTSAIYPQFAKITASVVTSTTFRLTADNKGEPFTVTIATTETGGGAADAQTIDGGASSVGTTTTASSGPNDWTTAANWSGGAIPVGADDIFIQAGGYDILYGLAQSAVTLTSLTIDQSFQPNNNGNATIGLPEQNEDGYAEDNGRYLQISATTLRIGRGVGAGSGRIKIDVGSVACTCIVEGTGQGLEPGLEAFLFKGTSASNILQVNRGSVGVAVFAGETANVTGGLKIGYVDNVQSDAIVKCGSGVTMPTVQKSGGKLDCASNVTTFTQTAGESWHRSGAVATLSLQGGVYHENASGTSLTTGVTVFDRALLDFGQDLIAKTVTPKITVYKGAKIDDPFGIVTLTAGWMIPNGTLRDVDLNFGAGQDYTVS